MPIDPIQQRIATGHHHGQTQPWSKIKQDKDNWDARIRQQSAASIRGVSNAPQALAAMLLVVGTPAAGIAPARPSHPFSLTPQSAGTAAQTYDVSALTPGSQNAWPYGHLPLALGTIRVASAQAAPRHAPRIRRNPRASDGTNGGNAAVERVSNVASDAVSTALPEQMVDDGVNALRSALEQPNWQDNLSAIATSADQLKRDVDRAVDAGNLSAQRALALSGNIGSLRERHIDRLVVSLSNDIVKLSDGGLSIDAPVDVLRLRWAENRRAEVNAIRLVLYRTGERLNGFALRTIR